MGPTLVVSGIPFKCTQHVYGIALTRYAQSKYVGYKKMWYQSN
jgi:hypothetical protein